MNHIILHGGLIYEIFYVSGLGVVGFCFPDVFTCELMNYYLDFFTLKNAPEVKACFYNRYGTIVKSYLPYYDPSMQAMRAYPLDMVCFPEAAEDTIKTGKFPDLSNATHVTIINFIEISDPKSLNPLGFTPYVKEPSAL